VVPDGHEVHDILGRTMTPGPPSSGGRRPDAGAGSLRRFLTLADVAEVLNTSPAQVYALVRSGELPAIKLGGRGQWRVEIAVLDDYIQTLYDATKRTLDENRRGGPDQPDVAEPADEETTNKQSSEDDEVPTR
jgi:excisionase family DNA binding protein